MLPSAVGPWPLKIPPRTLAVLAHILLRQQQQRSSDEASPPKQSSGKAPAGKGKKAWEEEDKGGHKKDIVTCMQVWERFLGTLTDRAVKGEAITEAEGNRNN